MRLADLTDILKGKKARRTIPFPGVVRTELPQGETAPTVVLDVVVLDGHQEAAALAGARAFAKGKGVDAPKEGEPEYELGLMVHTLLLACLDHESPPGAPAPFFASADQILQHLDRERISYLYTLQQVWQDELSPARKSLDEGEVLGFVLRAADAEDPLRFFEELQPAMLARLLHSTAKQLVTLLRIRSQLGSSSSPSGETTSTPTSQSDGASAEQAH
jgi:hypothetical protein